MSFDSNIHSRTGNLVKLSLLILAMAFLSACATPGVVSLSTCPANVDLVLQIVQDDDGDAKSILCLDDKKPPESSDCTNDEPTKARVYRGGWARWELESGDSSPQFYVIFDKDQSIRQAGNGRGPNRVASTDAKLCVKASRAAKSSPEGEPYRYSVYVKHCDEGDTTCRPKVLDPIIYVWQ